MTILLYEIISLEYVVMVGVKGEGEVKLEDVMEGQVMEGKRSVVELLVKQEGVTVLE